MLLAASQSQYAETAAIRLHAQQEEARGSTPRGFMRAIARTKEGQASLGLRGADMISITILTTLLYTPTHHSADAHHLRRRLILKTRRACENICSDGHDERLLWGRESGDPGTLSAAVAQKWPQ